MGKAKDGSECYTRINKSGGKYITCEGTQKGGKKKPIPPDSARAKARRAGQAKKLRRPAGRIDTNAPRNVGVVADKQKSKPKENSYKSEKLKDFGITRDVKEDEVRFGKQKRIKYISAKDEDEFITRIQKLGGWTTDYAPLSVAQRKKLINLKGRNDIILREKRGMGTSRTTRGLNIEEWSWNERANLGPNKGVVRIKNLPSINFKFIGKK